jgi:uncharacterized pyridoxal phosphate-containing UPF0001 family protein
MNIKFTENKGEIFVKKYMQMYVLLYITVHLFEALQFACLKLVMRWHATAHKFKPLTLNVNNMF